MSLWTRLANAVSRWLNFEPKPPAPSWDFSILDRFAETLPMPENRTALLSFKRSAPFECEEVAAKAPRKPRKAITKKAVGRSSKPTKRSQKAPVKAKRASSRKASKSKAKGRKKT